MTTNDKPEEVSPEERARREEEAVRRAVDGINEPVFYKGRQVGDIRRFSDTLLIFLMKAGDPARTATTTLWSTPGPVAVRSLLRWCRCHLAACRTRRRSWTARWCGYCRSPSRSHLDQ